MTNFQAPFQTASARPRVEDLVAESGKGLKQIV